jgi:hypothetical protein
MTYQIPDETPVDEQDYFTFVTTAGTEFKVPAIQFIPPRMAAGLGTVASIIAALDELAPGAVDEIPQNAQFNSLLSAWTKFSKATLGESKASSSS